MHEKTPQQVYEELSAQGLYEEANLDRDEAEKIRSMAWEDYQYANGLKRKPNWRVIFNIHYDSLRELCSVMLRFKQHKTSNHQGLFAFIVLNFPELDLDWDFFETVRKMRNQNKYLGINITQEMWKHVEFQTDFYIKKLNKEIRKRLT